MSNHKCKKCGAHCVDTPRGYVTGCEHYPPDAAPPGVAIAEAAPKQLELWPDLTVPVDEFDAEFERVHKLRMEQVKPLPAAGSPADDSAPCD